MKLVGTREPLLDSCSGSSAWTPANYPGILDYWEADSGLTVATGVSAWVGKFAGLTLSQATAGLQPTFNATGLNGKPSITFDGVDDYLQSATNGISMGSNLASFFMVGAYLNNSGNCRLVSFTKNGASTDYDNAGSAAAILGSGTPNTLSCYVNNVERCLQGVTLNVNIRHGNIYDGTNITVYKDNVAGNTSAYSSAFGATGTLALGAAALALGGYAGVRIGSILVARGSAVTSGDRLNLDNYFKAKWGL